MASADDTTRGAPTAGGGGDDHSADREARLEQVLAEYLLAADQGAAPDPRAFAAAHPEFAADLAEFFADREQFRQLAGAPAGPAVDPAGETRPAHADPGRSA